MERTQELLRGSAVHWMAKVKEAVFADNEDKDVKKIKTKYHNMKTSWKAAKKLQEESGFGVKEVFSLRAESILQEYQLETLSVFNCFYESISFFIYL